MGNVSETQANLIHDQLAVPDQRAKLSELYHLALRETLFSNRGELRPAQLKRLASAEVESALAFIRDSDREQAQRHGAQLCQAGLGQPGLLELGQVTRQFCLTQLPDRLHLPALSITDAYFSAIIHGFIQAREATLLQEQELIRLALQRTIESHVTQMQTAADVGRIVTTFLELDELLRAAVELLQERFGLYYAGIFLVDEFNQWAVLRAGTGEPGREMLQRGHKLQVGGKSMIGQCVATSEARIALDVGKEAIRFENPLLPETHSEMALPLVSRGQVIGAVTIQHHRVGAFSEQDITVMRLITDQLANAINNVRLFAEAQTNLAEARASQRRYVQQAWTSGLPEQAAYLYEQNADAFASPGDVWRPEMEQALQTNQPVVSKGQMALPIILRGQVIGALDLYDVSTPHEWSEEDIALATTVAAQTAFSLENARLFEQTQESLSEARVLYEASRRVSSAANPQEMLMAVAEGVHVPEINRVVLWDLEYSITGEPEAFILTGAWQSGTDAHPLPLGTRMALKQFPAANLAIANDPIFVDDVYCDERIDPVTRATFQQQPVRGLALLPLWVGNRQLGLLMLVSEQPHHFADKEIRPYTSLARQIAIALENRRLFDQTRAALEEVETTQRRYLGQQWEKYLVTAADKSAGFVDGPLGLTATDSLWLPEMEQALEVGEPIFVVGSEGPSQRSALALPLKLRGMPIGVLEFYEEGARREWSNDEQALVQALADQAVLALENARLFEDTQARAQREQLINQITARVRASTDMQTILRTTSEELTRVLDLPWARIRLGIDEGNGQAE